MWGCGKPQYKDTSPWKIHTQTEEILQTVFVSLYSTQTCNHQKSRDLNPSKTPERWVSFAKSGLAGQVYCSLLHKTAHCTSGFRSTGLLATPAAVALVPNSLHKSAPGVRKRGRLALWTRRMESVDCIDIGTQR